MPRYEHRKTSSFWEIEKSPDGKAFTARWGKLGTDGRSKTKRFEDSYACSSEYDELIAEKLKLGYATIKPAKLVFTLRSNPELEATLCESVEDPARWAVYADWLQEAGDFRGEMIALGLAGKLDEARAIADANADVMWGDAWNLKAGDAFVGVTWMPAWQGAEKRGIEVAFDHTVGPLGFIESIKMSGLDEEGHVAKALHAVVSAPIGRFVRSIELHACHDQAYSGASGQPNFGTVAAALAGAKPTALRRLVMTTAGYQISWTNTGDLSPLLAATPHLEVLSIEMGDIDLGTALALPKLRSLMLETGGLGRANIQAIATAPWPELRELSIYFGTANYGGDATAADVDALVANQFPRLEVLALCNSEVPGAICAAIAKSPLLAQLRVLDLSKGTMTDEDARPLVDNLAAFKHLERLDLSENYLSPALEDMLARELGDIVSTDGSRFDDMVRERDRYGHEDWAKDSTFRYTVVSE